MLRRYVCNKYKSYSIRNHYFINGLFETEDPQVQKLIEHADGYGVFIHPVETKEEIATMRAKEKTAKVEPALEEPPPIAHQGARGTGTSSEQRRSQLIVVGNKN